VGWTGRSGMAAQVISYATSAYRGFLSAHIKLAAVSLRSAWARQRYNAQHAGRSTAHYAKPFAWPPIPNAIPHRHCHLIIPYIHSYRATLFSFFSCVLSPFSPHIPILPPADAITQTSPLSAPCDKSSWRQTNGILGDLYRRVAEQAYRPLMFSHTSLLRSGLFSPVRATRAPQNTFLRYHLVRRREHTSGV